MSDKVEFYLGSHLLLMAQTSFAPDFGDIVNIKGKSYEVVGRAFIVSGTNDIHCDILLDPPKH